MWYWVGSAGGCRDSESLHFHEARLYSLEQQFVGLAQAQAPHAAPLPRGFPLAIGNLRPFLQLGAESP